MPGDSDRSGWLKWGVSTLIALLGAGGGIAAWLEFMGPRRSQPPPPTPAGEAALPSPAVECFISGRVLDEESHQPLPSVEVGYFRTTRDANDWIHGVRARLATTGSDGSFEADCTNVEPENFPIRVQLQHHAWGGVTHQTNEYVNHDQRRTSVNLYVRDRLLRSQASGR